MLAGEKVIVTNGELMGRTGIYLYDQYEDEQLRAVMELEDEVEIDVPKEYIESYDINYINE